MTLTIGSFFKYYIYTPDSPFLSEKEKKIVFIARKIFSFLTFTLLPRLCEYLWAKDLSYVRKIAFAKLKQEIQSAKAPPKIEAHSTSRESPIFGGLYLGNYYGLTAAIAGSLNYHIILTLCPLDLDFHDFSNFDFDWEDNAFEDAVSVALTNRKVSWLHLGPDVQDGPLYWPNLVYNCTQGGGWTEKSIEVKKLEIGMLNPWKLFAKAFKAIDEAVIHQKRVLVHCHAGMSRSAIVIAAYLVNRCGVNADQAITYLQSKRNCVSPSFIAQLVEYHHNLTTPELPLES